MILSILAYLAHFGQFYFSSIFSAINLYDNFLLTYRKNCNDWRQQGQQATPLSHVWDLQGKKDLEWLRRTYNDLQWLTMT